MRHRTNGPRLLAGLALILGLLASTAGTGDAQEVGSVTIYKIECPAGFDSDNQADLYNACYGNPVAGQSFSAQQGKSDEAPAVDATGADGNVTLPLYGGATTISEGLPQGIGEYFVFCSHEDGSAVDFQYTGDTFGIFLEQEGGDYFGEGTHIHCDWYNVPAVDGDDGGREGSISIYRTSCPAGYAGDAYYEDCYDNPAVGAYFSIHEAGQHVGVGFTTGPDGYTLSGLLLLTPGSVVVAESAPLPESEPIEYLDYVVYCSKDEGATAVPVGYGQPNLMDVVLDAEPDDAIACDWFYVPPAVAEAGDGGDGDGTVTVYATACPEGYAGDDYFEDCYDNPVAGVAFAVNDAKTDFRASDTTSADGFASLPVPEVVSGGELALGQVPPGEVPGGADPPFVVSCTENGGQDVVDVRYSLVQLDPGGDAYMAALAVEPGDTVRCDWYLLTTGDGDSGDGTSGSNVSGVTTLPNTGTGSTATDGDRSGAWTAASLLLIVAAAGTRRLVPSRVAAYVETAIARERLHGRDDEVAAPPVSCIVRL